MKTLIRIAILGAIFPVTQLVAAQEKTAVRANEKPTVEQRVTVGSCNVKFTDYYGGQIKGPIQNTLDVPSYRYEAPAPVKNSIDGILEVTLLCYDTEKNFPYPKEGAVRFDEKQNKWVKDLSAEVDKASDPSLYRELDKARHIYNIQAKNSNGFIYTWDETTGEPEQRERNVTYCLVHSPKAICGGASGMRLSNPKSDMVPFITKILRSMEFIDDAPQGSGASPTTIQKNE